MSNQINQIRLDLMTQVEKSVRPVMAPVSTKIQMRNELLNHLTELYATEIETTGDHNQAVQRAKERFGDPKELTPQLQATVSRFDFWVSNWFCQKQGESPIRFGFREAL